jgi:hypothetical protein
LPFLDYLEYNKSDALEVLQSRFGYKPYPYKHYESVFTRFYQGYLLPKKFGVDKRMLHLATLVAAGQLDREAALQTLRNSPYPNPDDLTRTSPISSRRWAGPGSAGRLPGTSGDRPRLISIRTAMWRKVADAYNAIRRRPRPA